MSSKKCYFTTIQKVERYSDPEINRIAIGEVDGNKVVIGINSEVGTTGIFFYPDCILTESFRESHGLTSSSFKNGRVRVARFKGEWSEGLFLPMTKEEVRDLFDQRFEIGDALPEHPDVYEVYVPKIKSNGTQSNQAGVKFKRGVLPEFPMHFDTEQFRSSIKEVERLFDSEYTLSISIKVHGTCLLSTSRIRMADGSIKMIKDVVVGDIVASKDGPTRVTDVFNYPNKDNWMELYVSHFGGISKLTCTDDHLIHTPSGEFIEAGKLSYGDFVSMSMPQIYPTEIQKDFHEGKLWGDGYFNKHLSLEYGHCEDQKDYFDYCRLNFGNLSGAVSVKTSGYGSKMNTVVNKVSRFLNNTPSYLNPRVLAIWYMDDGNLVHSEAQQDRAQLSVCRYSDEEIDSKIIPLMNQLGLYPVKSNNSDGQNRLRFNLDAANKLFSIISPYIPDCMRYKLPKDYPNNYSQNSEYQIGEVREYLYSSSIFKIGKVSLGGKVNKKRYDITTESHNFIANNIVVHNSARTGHVRVPKDFTWYEKAKIKFMKLFHYDWREYSRKLEERNFFIPGGYQIVNGSRRVILTEEKRIEDSGYHSTSFRDKSSYFKENLEKDVVVFYEVVGWENENTPIMAKGPNGYYDYGIPNGEFAIQVYRITKNGVDLPVKEMEEYAISVLNLAPVYRPVDMYHVNDHSFSDVMGIISEQFEKSAKVPCFGYIDEGCNSRLTHYTHVNEGIVIRMDPPPMLADTRPPKFFKLKRPEFYEEEGKIKAAELSKLSLEQE